MLDPPVRGARLPPLEHEPETHVAADVTKGSAKCRKLDFCGIGEMERHEQLRGQCRRFGRSSPKGPFPAGRGEIQFRADMARMQGCKKRRFPFGKGLPVGGDAQADLGQRRDGRRRLDLEQGPRDARRGG